MPRGHVSDGCSPLNAPAPNSRALIPTPPKSHNPCAGVLVRNILIALAAVPGAFPPVMIIVEANRRRYQEMHVDGGASAQVFVYPPSLQRLGHSAGIRRG